MSPTTTVEVLDVLPHDAPIDLFRRELSFDPQDIRALVSDFFGWFEHEWQQPVVQTSNRTPSLDHLPCGPFLEERMYTLPELSSVWGHSLSKVREDVEKLGVPAAGRLSHLGKGRGSGRFVYHARDLQRVVEAWEWEKFSAVVETIWRCYLQEPCGECPWCRKNLNAAVFYCRENSSYSIRLYRDSFLRFLEAVRHYESIETWWHYEQHSVFARSSGAVNQRSGIVLLYLLDRHLLDVSFDDILRLPLPDMEYLDLLRPWRHRRPEEYAAFLLGMNQPNYVEEAQRYVLALLALMILFKYGFPGVAELGRPLTTEEVQRVLQEGRLLTQHVGYGIFLDSPISDDIRLGHVLIDDIRKYFWDYAATRVRKTGRQDWNEGPRSWNQLHVQALERVLTAGIWSDGQGIISPRPETEKTLRNPHQFHQRAEREGNAPHLLPFVLQKAIFAYVNCRYKEQRIEVSTIKEDLKKVLPFLCWAREHVNLNDFDMWDWSMMREIVQAYCSDRCSNYNKETLHVTISKLYVFFHTLAKIALPHPPGYEAISSLLPSLNRSACSIPPEEVLDRVFRDGVCQLHHDPFARLALTIQYYCGTRVTETCELPLFCILEDERSEFAYLVIPYGKTKEERFFPIVNVGMGPLFAYMDQVARMQLSPDEKPLHFSRMNSRYLETDSKKAYRWDYLFDRAIHSPRRSGSRQRVLTPQRVGYALQEAILFAASQNPAGLFLDETYSPRCHRQRNKGQDCGYVALRDGIIICPICGGPLSGRRGQRCRRRLKQKFECDGVAQRGAYFCPKCDAPLAEMVSIVPHTFRHNSVTRAHRYGISLAENMLLHGHKTVPMHLRYLHLLPKDQQVAVYQIFSEKFLRDIQSLSSYTTGQVVEDGIAHTPNLEQLIGLTFRRGLTRRTAGLWGGFWAAALAEEGVMSPTKLKAEMIITEETYHHTVAQYRYEALGLAVSEVALERGTKGKFKATVAPFLERKEIERVVSYYLEHVQQGYLNTARGLRLFEADIKLQRAFLNDLADMLRPWWQLLGSIDRLVMELFPDIDVFQKQGATDALDQE